MNEPPDRQAKLLADVFHDDWTHGPVSAFARTAAVQARQRHRVRHGLLAVGVTAAVAAAFTLALSLRQPAIRVAPAPARTAPAYEIISDDELIARLSDRPLLILPKADGRRELVLLQP